MGTNLPRWIAAAAIVLFIHGNPAQAWAKEAPPAGENQAVTEGESGAARLDEAFQRKGFRLGSPVFLRIYKQSSEIELWVQKGPRFALFKTYPICRWSGVLGPKLEEGDRQSPEGLYRITLSDLVSNHRFNHALRLNYPNSYDIVNGHTGSGILIHGNCTSTGCFALANGVDELFEVVSAALEAGQASVPVLSLPFRFTEDRPRNDNPLSVSPFWRELKQADLLFDRDRLPPSAWLCDGRYFFLDRRGNAKRHAISTKGCQPLDKPIDIASIRQRARTVLAAAGTLSPKEAAKKMAESCDPRQPRCRMLRIAIKSDAICPKKYPRCRTAYAAYTKSVECPLKYPRCRWFVGPDPAINAGSKVSSVKVRSPRR